MPASTRRPGNRSRNTGDIADAVLQADDDGIRRRMLRDDIGDLGGIGALDGDQHHAGIAENLRDLPTASARSLRSCGRDPRSSSAAGRCFRFPRSRAAAPATRRGGRPPPACRRQSSRCCRLRPRRSVCLSSCCRSILVLRSFDSRRFRFGCLSNRQAVRYPRLWPRLVTVMARRYVSPPGWQCGRR